MSNTIINKIENIIRSSCVLLFAFSVCLLMAVIILREIFGISYDFLIDFVVWLMAWSVLLRIGLLYAEGGHIAIGLVLKKLPKSISRIVKIFNSLCTLAYVSVVTIGGVIAVQELFSSKQVYPRYISIPMWIVQIIVPIGFGLFCIYALVELWKTVKGHELVDIE